jgi:hypothetical protein
MTSQILAAALVWAAVFAIGWHYLVAPFPPLARRIPATRRRRPTPPHRDPTMTPRLRPHLLSALAFVMAATCGSATLASAQDTTTAKRLVAKAKQLQDSIAKRSTSPTIDGQAARSKLLIDSTYLVLAPKPAPPPVVIPPAPPSIQTARIELKPSTGSFPVGQSITLIALPKSAAGVTLTTPVSWSASPSSVATISGVGVLTAKSAGTVTVTARADTASRSVTYTVLPDLPPQPPVITPTDTAKQPPVVVVDSGPTPVPTPAPTPSPSASYPVPANLGGGTVAVAQLPRATVDVTYPTCTTIVRVLAGSDLQAALRSATPGVCLLLAQGAVFTGDFMLPKHAGAGANSCSGWVVVRTDVPDSLLGVPGTRMTPSRAASLRLAKLQSPDNQQAIGTAMGVPNVGCWRITGVEIAQAPGGADANGLVRFGDHTETDSTEQAHHLILDRSYVHGPNIRRCVILNSRFNAVVDSWVEKCTGPNGDTQALLAYAGTGPYLVQNNTLSGGAEVMMIGGANGGIVGATPSDFTIHGNVFTRQLSDTTGLVKNLFEVKNAERVDFAGNVLSNNWNNGQVGFALLLKSVNQSSGPCSWCRSRDITVRYNQITNSASGMNLAGILEGPAQPAARYTIYQNTIGQLGFRPKADGIPFQILGNGGTLSDVIIAYNTVSPAPWGLVSYDGGPTARQAWQSNVLYCGGYGAKGSATGVGLPTFTAFAPGVVWTGNVLYGCGSGFPAGTTYSGSLTSALTSGAGADTAAVNAATRNAVVAP